MALQSDAEIQREIDKKLREVRRLRDELKRRRTKRKRVLPRDQRKRTALAATATPATTVTTATIATTTPDAMIVTATSEVVECNFCVGVCAGPAHICPVCRDGACDEAARMEGDFYPEWRCRGCPFD